MPCPCLMAIGPWPRRCSLACCSRASRKRAAMSGTVPAYEASSWDRVLVGVAFMFVASPPNGGAPQPAVQELAALTSFSTCFSVSAHRPWLCPPDVLPRAPATFAAGGLLRTFASCSSGSREQRMPPDMKLSISATHCSCNIWSHESVWRPTLGVSRLLKQMQQQCRPACDHKVNTYGKQDKQRPAPEAKPSPLSWVFHDFLPAGAS